MMISLERSRFAPYRYLVTSEAVDADGLDIQRQQHVGTKAWYGQIGTKRIDSTTY